MSTTFEKQWNGKIMFIIYIPQTHTLSEEQEKSPPEFSMNSKWKKLRKTVHVRKREVSEWCVSVCCICVWLMPLSPSDYHAWASLWSEMKGQTQMLILARPPVVSRSSETRQRATKRRHSLLPRRWLAAARIHSPSRLPVSFIQMQTLAACGI